MNDAARLAVGQAQYSALLYPQGTFVDDVIVHRLADDEYLLVINAGTREKDFNWVRENTRNFDCRVENLSDDFTQIAIQGPRAVAGEDGFEIYIPADEATSARVWNEILKTGKDLGILPCGLGARNTLRLEAKLPLYEHEISDTINVWEAGLDRFCKMKKPEFIGRAALEKARTEGLNRVLTGIEMIDRGIARDGYKVQDETGREIGYVTSGSPAPFLKKNIALAYVPPAFSEIGRELKVDIRGQGVTARVVPTPFYKRQKKT